MILVTISSLLYNTSLHSITLLLVTLRNDIEQSVCSFKDRETDKVF